MFSKQSQVRYKPIVDLQDLDTIEFIYEWKQKNSCLKKFHNWLKKERTSKTFLIVLTKSMHLSKYVYV